MSAPRHGLLVLAAGASRRLGEAKQLLRFDGESLVRRATRLGLATKPAQALLVVGAAADAVATEVADLPIATLPCPDWRDGLGASLAAGLHALDDGIDGALVVLCDQPGLDAAHLQALLAAWHANPTGAAASAYAGVLGVPALLPCAWFAELAAGDHDRGARDLLRQRAARVAPVPAPALAHDLDTPAQRENWAVRSSLGPKGPGE